LIAQALSAGDLDRVVGLYEADGVFVPPGAPASDAVHGRDAIREVVQQFLAIKPAMTVNLVKVLEVDEIALLTGSWRLTGQGSDGDIAMSGTFANIGRRQPDGTWLYVLDNPEVVA
jgi:uncharacterized protein (TIGR02246 family)